MNHIKYKSAMPKACKAKEHTFMVSGWKKSQSKDTALQFTCRHCLTTIPVNEYEFIREAHNAKAQALSDKEKHPLADEPNS